MLTSRSDNNRITRQDVIAAYRLFLGRNPENDGVVDEKLRHIGTLRSLVEHFVGSREFRERTPWWAPLDWPPMAVDVMVGHQELRKILSHVQQTWTELGRSEPYWSVLSSDDYKGQGIHHASRLVEFYNSGRDVVNTLLARFRRNGIDAKEYKTCVDFGCGVGRVTQWLAKEFESVIGVDVSREHLALADRQLTRNGISNVELRHLCDFDEVDALPGVDVIFSVIVLQHNPPPVMAFLLERLLRKLNRGGVALFQIPTYSLGYSFAAEHYIEYEMHTSTGIEMHVLPQEHLFRIINEANCLVLEIREDGWVGLPGWISNSVLVRGAIK